MFRQALGHHQARRLQDAEAGYRKVLAANPRHAGALGYLGVLAHQSGHSDAGIDLLRKAIAADRRNPEPHYNLARILSDCGRDDEAIVHNRKVLEIAPDFPGAHNNLAALLLLRGRAAEALTVAIKGLQSGDDSPGLKSTFVMALRSLDPAAIPVDAAFIGLLVRALTEPWSRPRDLSAVAGAILLRRPSMARCVARVAQGGAIRLDELFSAGDLAALESEGLLQALLTASPVTTLEAERVLTIVRRALLDGEAPLLLASAIGQQAFLNEYVFAVTGEEEAHVLKLRQSVEAALEREEAIPPIQIAVLACYQPLHTLARAESLAPIEKPAALRTLIRQQIADHRDEQAIRPTIERLTAIEDDVSEKVRQQYEENPYPRWSRLFVDNQALPLDHYIGMRFPGTPFRPTGNSAPEILVAGCGTGQHAIQRALQFRQGGVLAIDLSLSSLSYAIRKTKDLGLTNLRYAQADILTLDDSKTFDVIDSSGVLHHLKNPLQGWRRLAGLVRPRGLMHIGLYSAIARKDINAARNDIAARGLGYSVAEVRRLRADIAARSADDPLHAITQFSDFFSMSECRDLLFHVQEHQFTIPQIADFLAQAGFTFLGFETSARANYLRRFPDDRAATNLANWAIFENENPATFAQMYQFWIQKN